MELELLLSTQWPHMAMLHFLQHFVLAAFLVLTELNPKLILWTLSLGAGATSLQSTMENCSWSLDTSSYWWDRLVMERWDDQQWLQNFCWSWSCVPGSSLPSGATPPCGLPSPWKLTTPNSYWLVGNQFSVGKSTVGALLVEVMSTVNSILIHLGDLDPIVAGFAVLGFPNCGGAIDGTHIPIHAPQHRAAQYINRKGYFSMVLQALVDHRGQFMDIYVVVGQGMRCLDFLQLEPLLQAGGRHILPPPELCSWGCADTIVHRGGYGLPSDAMAHEAIYRPPGSQQGPI
ncbi:uncharacterized protein LOC142819308 [Pelodiscus sinensis]|uniref:uncharacterized protein LOC142819308 n=1 Tax=Pelodiscus sinensis TaxID=13735 RepID=UPI003F6B4A8B